MSFPTTIDLELLLLPSHIIYVPTCAYHIHIVSVRTIYIEKVISYNRGFLIRKKKKKLCFLFPHKIQAF